MPLLHEAVGSESKCLALADKRGSDLAIRILKGHNKERARVCSEEMGGPDLGRQLYNLQ